MKRVDRALGIIGGPPANRVHVYTEPAGHGAAKSELASDLHPTTLGCVR